MVGCKYLEIVDFSSNDPSKWANLRIDIFNSLLHGEANKFIIYPNVVCKNPFQGGKHILNLGVALIMLVKNIGFIGDIRLTIKPLA